jgi:hypothetical protein
LFLAPGLSLSLALICGIYLLLNVVVMAPREPYLLLLHLGGALTGLVYGWQLRQGSRPGNSLYNFLTRIGRFATPDEDRINARRAAAGGTAALKRLYEARSGISQQRIDEILDKINDRGYGSLTREEKDLLLRAGKE